MPDKFFPHFLFALLFCWPIAFGSAAYAAKEISVIDYQNTRVTLNAPARRIVALAPHIVENIYSAGLGNRIVGVVEYSDYPEEASKITRVGAYSSISIESIVAQKPDLVLVWGSGNGLTVIEKLKSIGLEVYVDNPHKLEDVARSIIDIAILGGNEKYGRESALRYINGIENIREQAKGKPLVDVFYQVWNQPLQTLNGKHIISDLIRACGGRNIFAAEPSIAPKVGLESVISLNPDIIVASGMGESRPEWLDEWKKYAGMSAVKNNYLFHIHPDLLQRHTVRILEGAEQMCRVIDKARMQKKARRQKSGLFH